MTYGQRNRECSALIVAFNIDLAIVLFNNLVANGETQPRPDTDTFCGETGVKNLRKVFGINTGAGIGDRNSHRVTFPGGLNGNRTAFGDCLRCIDKKVHEDLIETVGVTLDRWQVSILFLHLNPSLKLMLGDRQRTVDAFVNIGFLEVRFINTSEILEAANNRNKALRGQGRVLTKVAQDLDELFDPLFVRAA